MAKVMDALVIKPNAIFPTSTLMKWHDNFVKQLETGVVIIPAYFDVAILNVPDGIEVVMESTPESEFMSKKFNI